MQHCKFLIGISPQGAVTCISDAWGGHAIDKHITVASGLLEMWLPGNLILADHGFDIRDSITIQYLNGSNDFSVLKMKPL